MIAIGLAERGLVPDPAVRWGIRRLLKDRLAEESSADTIHFTSRGVTPYSCCRIPRSHVREVDE